ncbi:hypothetical protein C8R45DRAFT_359295 [Mycena sanguinolenta]|nr:hypothetical protein C8R45DRAFT_359295 [Mycena sanguinolenta]
MGGRNVRMRAKGACSLLLTLLPTDQSGAGSAADLHVQDWYSRSSARFDSTPGACHPWHARGLCSVRFVLRARTVQRGSCESILLTRVSLSWNPFVKGEQRVNGETWTCACCWLVGFGLSTGPDITDFCGIYSGWWIESILDSSVV